jgi:hypothetical protein
MTPMIGSLDQADETGAGETPAVQTLRRLSNGRTN